ncbi:MAG: CADD family putative folate metabolism protein [Candidatus Limnocylindrales bacterium]
MTTILDQVDAMIDERHLLKHTFYTKWAAGTLPREAMQEYARQYFAFESAFPQFLSAMHSREDRADIRQGILENLWDEEHGEVNHAELWLRFAEGIGVSREDVLAAPRNEATQKLVDLYRVITTTESIAAGMTAMYAYERQVPEVAPSKISGLKEHYGITEGPTLSFFVVHGELDVEHAGTERELIGRIASGEETAIASAAERVLDAWNDFLTAVDMPSTEAVVA